MEETQPPYEGFFRVQHYNSYTNFDWGWDGGFTSNGHYEMPLSHWINREMFENHLNVWSAVDPSPFISVFDNRRDAYNRARLLVSRGCQDVFVAHITSSFFELDYLQLDFWEEGTVYLPAWVGDDGTTFISTQAVMDYLGVDHWHCHPSEWFALEHIPIRMIYGFRDF